jgi:glycosyltransferase involved in cell wall biosynthesis
VNDCSPDDSAAILEEYARRDDRIKIVDHDVNMGASRARFTGMEHAAGRYFVFVDSDDWIPRGALHALYNRIEAEESDIVTGSMVKVLDRRGIIRSKPRNSFTPTNRTEPIVMPELFDTYFINYFGVNLLPSYMCGKIYRRTVIERASPVSVAFPMFEDMIFNLMLHPFLTKIGFVTDTVYYYRFGGGTSTSTLGFLDAVKKQYRIKQEYIARYNYNVATPYIKIELINCFYSHFANLVLLNGLSYDEVGGMIGEELRDEIYSDDLFEGIAPTPRAAAMRERNVTKIVRMVGESVKKSRPRRMLKTVISKILS